MSWFWKTKDEQVEEATLSVEELKEKFKDYLNCCCLVNGEIRVYRDFRIEDGRVKITHIDKDTPEGKVYVTDYAGTQLAYGSNFIMNHRHNFLKLEHSLKIMGFKIIKKS
jgi:hypothetical protein